MPDDDFVLSYDTRPVRVGTSVRKLGCDTVWQVKEFVYEANGRAWLSLVDPADPSRVDSAYVDRCVVADGAS